MSFLPVSVGVGEFFTDQFVAERFCVNISTGIGSSKTDTTNTSLAFHLSLADYEYPQFEPLFLQAPSISPNGTLSFRTSKLSSGTAIFNVTLIETCCSGKSSAKSRTLQFSIYVIPAPSFEFVDQSADSACFIPKDVFAISCSFEMIAAGSLPILLSLDRFVTNVTTGFSAEARYDLQSVTFQVLSISSAPVFYKNNVFITQNGTLYFELNPGFWGVVLLNISLLGEIGLKSNDYVAEIKVMHFNQAPTFEMVFNLIDCNETQGPFNRFVDGFISNISAGFNEDLGGLLDVPQRVSFVIYPIKFRQFQQQEWSMGSELSDAIPIEKVDITINLTIGNLYFATKPYKYGDVLFSVYLVDNGGIQGGKGENVSKPRNFTLSVLPVNQPPSFDFVASYLVINESSGCQTERNFVTNITKGPENEEYQTLTFSFLYDLVPYGVFQYVSLKYNGSKIDMKSADFLICPSQFWSGTFDLILSVKDDGGVERGGQDEYSKTIQITVLNNFVPSFRLISDSIIIFESDAPQGLNGTYVYSPFVLQMDLGLADYCANNRSSLSINFGCPNETGIFVVTAQNQSSNSMFSVPPLISFPQGVLEFKIASFTVGFYVFNITLMARESATDYWRYSHISNLFIYLSKDPILEIVGNVTLRQDAGFFESLVARYQAPRWTSIVDYQFNIDNESMFETGSFHLVMNKSEFYIRFLINSNVSGSANVKIVVNGIFTGLSSERRFSVSNVLRVLVNPIKKPPHFDLLWTFFAVNSSADVQVVSNIPFATNISPNDDLQRLAFVTYQISDPSLFSAAPALTSDGFMSFSISPFQSGICFVDIALIDRASGYSPDYIKKRIYITVDSGKSRPRFSLQKRVSCLTEDDLLYGKCTCDLVEDSHEVCQSLPKNSTSSVDIIQNASEHQISDFVTLISTQEYSRPAFMARVVTNTSKTSFNPLERTDEPILSMPGLEYSVDYAFNDKRSYIYTADLYQNSVSLFKLASDGLVDLIRLMNRILSNAQNFTSEEMRYVEPDTAMEQIAVFYYKASVQRYNLWVDAIENSSALGEYESKIRLARLSRNLLEKIRIERNSKAKYYAEEYNLNQQLFELMFHNLVQEAQIKSLSFSFYSANQTSGTKSFFPPYLTNYYFAETSEMIYTYLNKSLYLLSKRISIFQAQLTCEKEIVSHSDEDYFSSSLCPYNFSLEYRQLSSVLSTSVLLDKIEETFSYADQRISDLFERDRLTLLDRVTGGEIRFRFYDAAIFDPAPAAPEFVCSWKSFAVGNEHFFAAASSCKSGLLDVSQKSFLDRLKYTQSSLHDISQCSDQFCYPATVGFWDFSRVSLYAGIAGSRYAVGANAWRVNNFTCSNPSDLMCHNSVVTCNDTLCIYKRKAVADSVCKDEFDITIEPGVFRDFSQKLGAAVVTGPVCRNLSNAQNFKWDRKYLSAEVFLSNNGLIEAIQFGSVNQGLYVAADIDDLVNGDPIVSRLPLLAISIEVWFTIDTVYEVFSGLLAVQQDGPLCKKGWSLGYSQKSTANGLETVFQFMISLEANQGDGKGEFSNVAFLANNISTGSWNHLVALYDGKYIALVYNGKEMRRMPVCPFLNCGKIIYPASYDKGGKCSSGLSSLTIGTYDNQRINKFPHNGLIKSARIFNQSIPVYYANVLYRNYSDILSKSPSAQGDYWVSATNIIQTRMDSSSENETTSPSVYQAPAGKPFVIDLNGKFLKSNNYSCSFRYVDGSEVSFQGYLFCLTAACVYENQGSKELVFGDTLRCWYDGNQVNRFTAALLGLLRNKPESVGQELVWQQICQSDICRFTSNISKYSWWIYDLNPSLSGSLSVFYFIAESSIYYLNNSVHKMNLVASLPSSVETKEYYHQCFLQSQQIPLFCLDSQRSLISNIVDVQICFVHDETYVVVANGWDGLSDFALSSVFYLNLTGKMLVLRQVIETNDAQGWIDFKVNGILAIAVANFGGASTIYDCQGGFYPINLNRSVDLDVAFGTISMDSFMVGNGTYLVTAVFQNPRLSSLYKIGRTINLTHTAFGNLIEIHPAIFRGKAFSYTKVPWPCCAGMDQAIDVKHFCCLKYLDNTGNVILPLKTKRVLAITGNGSKLSTQIFLADEESDPPEFEFLQSLHTTSGSSISFWESNGSFILVTQTNNTSILAEWNGSYYQEPQTFLNSLSPQEGQYLFPMGAYSAIGFSVPGPNLEWILASVSQNASSTGSYLQAKLANMSSLVLPYQVQTAFLNKTFIYVVSLQTHTITVFSHNVVSEILDFEGFVGTQNNWSMLESKSLETNISWLISIQYISVSPDEKNLYASCFDDGAVAVFDIDQSIYGAGRLVLTQILNNQADFSLNIMSGAFSISSNLQSVYVTSLNDQAIAVFSRNADGKLTFIDAVQNGQRYWTQEMPMRIGDFFAGHSTLFFVSGMLHVALISVEDSSTRRLEVYVWKERTLQPEFVYSTSNDLISQASDIAYFAAFSIKKGALCHYIAVCSDKVSETQSNINVFEWDSDLKRLTLVIVPVLYFDDDQRAHICKSITPFWYEGALYVAAAYFGVENSTITHSYIYRWFESPKGGPSLAPFVLIPTNGASHIKYMEIRGVSRPLGLLFVCNAFGQMVNGNGAGSVEIFDVGELIGEYETIFVNMSGILPINIKSRQSIVSTGPSSVEPFKLEGEGIFFLAISNKKFVYADTFDLTMYDTASQIYVWNSLSEQFDLFQTLSDFYPTPVDPLASMELKQLFCLPYCSENVSQTIPVLRGVSSFKAFESGGELYLAVAQGICDGLDLDKCTYWTAQPQSSVFQYNKGTNQFGEVLLVTEEDSFRYRGKGLDLGVYEGCIPDRNSPAHQCPDFAIRLNAGKATQIHHVLFDGAEFLFVSSLSKGALVFNWSFGHIQGLDNIRGIVSDDRDSRVYAVGASTSNVLQLSRGNEFDSVEKIVSRSGRCSYIVKCLVISKPQVQPKVSSTDANLYGVRKISWYDNALDIVTDNCRNNFSEFCELVVIGGLFPSALLCGAFPLHSVQPPIADVVSAQCQTLSFVVLVEDGDKLIFASLPEINSLGDLIFKPSSNTFGTATLQVFLVDSAGSVSNSELFTITVKSSEGLAQHNTSGSISEDSFSFTVPDNLTIFGNSGFHVVEMFATSISTNGNPDFWFSLGNIECLTCVKFNKSYSPSMLFSSIENSTQFVVMSNGTAFFEVISSITGSFAVTIVLNVKTQSSSKLFISREFTLNILPRSPTIVSLGEIVLNSTNKVLIRKFSNFFALCSTMACSPLSIAKLTNVSLFLEKPRVDSNGTLSFILTPFVTGSATLDLTVVAPAEYRAVLGWSSQIYRVELFVAAFNAEMSSAYSISESKCVGSRFITKDVVLAVSRSANSENCTWIPGFASLDPACASVATDLLEILSVENPLVFAGGQSPTLDQFGTLSFCAPVNAAGESAVVARLLLPAAAGVAEFLNTFKIVILPLPQITAVMPSLGPEVGGGVIEIRGRLSCEQTGQQAALDLGITITIGDSLCVNLTVISNDAVACIVPAGRGMAQVRVSVSCSGLPSRQAFAPVYYRYARLYGGGTGARGIGGLGLIAAVAPKNVTEVLDLSGVEVKGSVAALCWFAGRLYAGGSFRASGGIRNMLSWDGNSAVTVGLGVDGAVTAMTQFAGILVAGGSFTRVYNARASIVHPIEIRPAVDAVVRGSLAAWDGTAWSTLPGAATPFGPVSALLTSGQLLYAAGRTTGPAARGDAGTVAAYDGAGWTLLGAADGPVYALAAHDGAVYAGGGFSAIAGVSAGGLAVWEPGRGADEGAWRGLGRFDGPVRAVARLAGDLYAGGYFATVDGTTVPFLARHVSGQWGPPSGGWVPDGGVNALATATDPVCLYAAGAFASVSLIGGGSGGIGGGVIAAAGIGRWCAGGGAVLVFEPISGSVGTVLRALIPPG